MKPVRQKGIDELIVHSSSSTAEDYINCDCWKEMNPGRKSSGNGGC